MKLEFVHFEDAFAEWPPDKFRTTDMDSASFFPNALVFVGAVRWTWDVCSVALSFQGKGTYQKVDLSNFLEVICLCRV